MSPKGQTLCLLLTVACPWLPCEAIEYVEFLKRHLDYPKSTFGNDNAYCEAMMHDRGMLCWQSNTFVHASEYEVQSLCSSRGHLVAELERSSIPFPITVCSRRGKKPQGACSYEGKSLTKEIWVTCLKGLPVYFNKYG
ncbi:ribonuclease-like [Heteronotia binoei]|uniref:ribonuclease-like n=1 Tax=Heteronotia binoei TaxID=13085 RepID=UPI00292EFF91|nr:ribonuclease-like [Heteronotia binoei]